MKQKLVEGEDYYFTPEGLMVFTRRYLLERGLCCGNGCRHCPFEYRNVPEPLRSKLAASRAHDRGNTGDKTGN